MDELIEECDRKVELGNYLLNTIESKDSSEISGLKKLKTKIQKEIKFLIHTREKGLLKKEHISGTNLNHFEVLVAYLLEAKDCTSVLKVFHFRPNVSVPSLKRVDVDVVSDKKKKWTKVIARNPKALSIISKGEGGFGQKSIIDHAMDYLECAKQNTHLYKAPYVEFYFGSGIDRDLAHELVQIGIHVSGKILEEDFGISEDHSDNIILKPKKEVDHEIHSAGNDDVTKLNLDVTTMISYVSALTNGHAEREVKGKMLQEQAAMERARPLKPILENIFKGKQLYACESAVNSFQSLVDIMGGEGEKCRTKELLGKVKVVEDASVDQSLIGRRRSAVVFATGQAIKALTVTANKSYVNSAAMQGLHFEVVIHEPRGLSESKEISKGGDL